MFILLDQGESQRYRLNPELSERVLSQEILLENIFSSLPISSGRNINSVSKLFRKVWINSRFVSFTKDLFTNITKNRQLSERIILFSESLSKKEKQRALLSPEAFWKARDPLDYFPEVVSATQNALDYFPPFGYADLFPGRESSSETSITQRIASWFRKNFRARPSAATLLENTELLNRMFMLAQQELAKPRNFYPMASHPV